MDRGLLDLDEDVNRRLTSWQVPANADWQPVVTLRQLVSHCAGLTVHGFPGYRRHDTLPTLVGIEGTYRLRGELSFEVRRSGHRLVVTFAGQQPLEFLPMSAKRFMGKTVRTELHLSGHGGLIFVQGGANVACTRTE